jgi:hypothetical protein
MKSEKKSSEGEGLLRLRLKMDLAMWHIAWRKLPLPGAISPITNN